MKRQTYRTAEMKGTDDMEKTDHENTWHYYTATYQNEMTIHSNEQLRSNPQSVKYTVGLHLCVHVSDDVPH